MIAVDTNILVYAFRAGDHRHQAAGSLLGSLAIGSSPWAIPVKVIEEFLRVVTFPRRGAAQTPVALAFVETLLDSPRCRLIGPGEGYWRVLRSVIEDANARGNDINDAAIVSVCIENGVDTLVSEDRGLRRFDGIKAIGLDDFGVARERAPRYRPTKRKAASGARGR